MKDSQAMCAPSRLGLALCIAAAAVATQTASPDSNAESVSAGAQLLVSQETYDAWDGDWDNPHFLFPGSESPEPVRTGQLPEAGGDDDATKQITYISIGKVKCNIRADNPHAGSGPNGEVVKAKARANCTLRPVEGGVFPLPPPNTVLWTASLQLYGVGAIKVAFHNRTGYTPVWAESSTQVYMDNCVNSSYTHYAMVNIIPPWPYVYTGPVPPADDSKTATVDDC